MSLFVKFSLAFSSLAFATSFPLMHRFPPAFRVLLDLNLSNIKVWVIFFFARNTCSRQRPILHQHVFLQTWNLCLVLFDGAHSSIKVPSKGNIFLSSGSGSLLKWSFNFFIIIFELTKFCLERVLLWYFEANRSFEIDMTETPSLISDQFHSSVLWFPFVFQNQGDEPLLL